MDRDSIIKLVKGKDHSYDEKALAVFEYQYIHNLLYQRFVHLVRYNDFKPKNVRDIPYFPISLFKSNAVKCGDWTEEVVFKSSGTTIGSRSQHFIRDAQHYLDNAAHLWAQSFDSLKNYTFLSLLPSYHENSSSSLLYMVKHFMLTGKSGKEAYFLNDHSVLHDKLEHLLNLGERVVLFGVSFALLDYLDEYSHQGSSRLIVVETGGMKKYKKELTREELHARLRTGFGRAQVVSEYGMTECLSQMYCTDHKSFEPNDRMRISIADPTDPGVHNTPGKRGRVYITDLANIDSVAFIATDDLGISDEQGKTQILGRLDNSDIRGCNYLI